jgi:DNA-binding transcriptional MerR regulator
MSSTDHPRTIAEIAEEFGITHRAIRFYEDQGLINPERRGTQRIFHPRDRVRLGLVLRGKRLGFDLGQIRRIVDMYDEPPGEAGQLRYLLERIAARRAELEQRRRDIEITLKELDEVERRCKAEPAVQTAFAANHDDHAKQTEAPLHKHPHRCQTASETDPLLLGT